MIKGKLTPDEIAKTIYACYSVGFNCPECPNMDKAHQKCKEDVRYLTKQYIQSQQLKNDHLTARAEKAEAERDVAVEFAIRAEQDYMECDKMFIHVGDLKQKTGYNAYLIDARQSGAKELSFGQWLSGLQKG